MPYDFRFRNPYAEAEEYSRRVKEDLVRVMNKPPLPKGPAPFQQLDEEREPALESRQQTAVNAVSGKKSKAPEFIQSFKAGKAIEDLFDLYAERVDKDDPNYGKDREKEILQRMDFYEAGLPNADREYEGVVDRYTSKDFYKGLLASLPLMDDPIAVQLGAGVGAKVISKIPVIGPFVAAGGMIGGVGAATHIESKDEASGAYQDAYYKALEEGKTQEEAHEIGKESYSKAYKANLALLGATNTAEQVAMFFNPAGGAASKVLVKLGKTEKAIKVAEKALARAERAAATAEKLKTAGKIEKAGHTAGKVGKEAGRIGLVGAMEAPQEMAQQVISQWATGEEIDPFAREVKEAGWAGFTMGIGLGGAGRALSAATDRLMNSGKEDDSDPHGALRAAALVNKLKGVELDPTRAHVELGISGNDLDEQGFAVGDTSDSKFPRIEEIDPILTENYYARIMESTSDEIKTLINNRVSNYMEAGMDQDEATFEALGNMMEQDTDFRDMVYGAYVETLGEYQTNAEEMFNRFAVYGAVLNKVSPETKELLQNLIIDKIKESGDVDGSLSYDGVMAAFLDTPEGAAVLNDIGLQDGSFWRQRSEELLIERASTLNSAPFSDRVQYFEGVLTNQEANGADIAPELLYQMYQDDLGGGVDLIDALYDSGKVGRDTLNRVAQGYLARAQQEQPQVFEGPSAQEQQEQEIEQGRREIKYARNLNKYSSFHPKYNKATRGHTPEQQATQQELDGAINKFIAKSPRLQQELHDFEGAHAIIAEPTAEQAKVQELIKKAFGHDVVFFEANPLIQENGAPSGIFDKETGTIFVNIKSKNPAMAVIGHELAHAMFVDGIFSKKFFGDFLAAVQNAGIKDAEYMDWLFQSLNSSEELTAESIEMAGDIMGHALNSEEFWSSLRKQSPRAFEQFYNALKKIVAEIKAVFTDVAPAHDMQQIFTEFDSLVSMAEKVAAEYSKHRQSRAVVRTHSILIEGSSGKKSQKQVFFVYDKETDLPIWRADVPGAAGRAEALEVARRINQGEATPDDIIAEYGEVEPVRQKGETDKKVRKTAREVAEEKYRAAEEAKAFAPGNIVLNPQGKEVVILEEKESTVRVRRTDVAEGEKGGKPYWISKKHLTPVKEKAPETPAKKTFLGISVDVFRKSMAETEEETVEGFRESLSEADYNDYRDLCDGLLGSNLNEKELGNAIEWFEEAYNYLSDILNMSETMSMGERPAYMRNRSEIRSSIKALKEAVAKKTNAKLDDSPLSYDVYSEELAEELIDYLFETDPKDGLYPWKWIQKKIEEEPFTDEALSKKSKDELDANLRYMDAIDRFAASVGAEEGSYLSDGSRVFDKEYTLKEYESEKEAALTVISDARSRIMRHIGGAKDSGSPTKPTLPTQEEVEDKILGEVFELDDHNRYYWYEIVDWAEEMANTEDPAAMQINLVYLEEAQKYAKGTQRSRDRVGERGFTEKYTPVMYNKERNEALDALNKAVKGLRKRVKALPQEEILTGEMTTTGETGETGETSISNELDLLDNLFKGKAAGRSSEGKNFRSLDREINKAQSKINKLEALLDDDFEFQSAKRKIPFYERAKAVLSQTHPSALPRLEEIRNDPEAIRNLVKELVSQENQRRADAERQARLAEAEKQRQKRLALEERSRKQGDQRPLREKLLAPEAEKIRLKADELAQANQFFDLLQERTKSGVELTSEELDRLERLFVYYNEAIAPASLEDSVPVRVLKRLGLDLEMGIDYDFNRGLRYYWSINGNIATYGQELVKLGGKYNEILKNYEWVSDNPNDSPLSKIMDKFGGERYVAKAEERERGPGEGDERGAITGFVRRRDVTRLTGSSYRAGTKGNPKQLFVTKGVKADKGPKIRATKKSWDTLKEHQKDGVNLAVQALDKYGAFVLADGTGAGKTAQMLTVAEHYSRGGEEVLIVINDEKTFNNVFVRDAKLLGIPTSKLNFIPAKKNALERGKLRSGSINVIAYNYISTGPEPIIQKLGGTPNLVIYDEAHNLKKAHEKTSRAPREGTELSLAADKSMFVTATVAETGIQLMYLEKLGFLHNYPDGLHGFMDKMGYYFVRSERIGDPGRWVSRNTQFTANQMDLFFHELTDAGLFLKRELRLDGVNVSVREYTLDGSVHEAMRRVSQLAGDDSNPFGKSQILMAQRRYLETQKIQETFNIAVEELEKGRQVIIFGELVNPTSLTQQVRAALMESPIFMEKLSEAAIQRGIPFGTEAQKMNFLELFLRQELKELNIPDGPGTLTELKAKFKDYFSEKQGKGPYYGQVAQIFGKIAGKKLDSEIQDYQDGVKRVALSTIQKGGVAISLDDIHGSRPRTIIFTMPPFSAIETLQALGRAWRLTTKSDVEVIFVKADHQIDNWGFDITLRKLEMLGASGQSDALVARRAMEETPAEAGALSPLEHRKPSEPATEPGAIPEFQQDWRARRGSKNVTSTPEFKEWFGDSKVTDEQGEPLVVYHGTPKFGFSEFKSKNKAGQDLGFGIHFSESPTFAEVYERGGKNSGTYEVYLSISNPLDLITDYGWVREGTTEHELALTLLKGTGRELHKETDPDGNKVYSLRVAIESVSPKKAERLIRSFGYDGVVYEAENRIMTSPNTYVAGESSRSYIAFEPTQIKSVYNQGTFDPANPDINYQQDWRARQKAAMDKADQTRSLQGLRQAHEEYYQGEAAEARERGDEVRAAEIEEVGQLAAEHVEVMESVRNDALDFFSFFGPQETQEQETRASDSKGKKKKDEGMWEYIRRVFGMRRNAETRELAYIPASELVEGGKGAGFSIDQGSLEKAGMEIQQSANNAELGPLERFLVKDNLMNVFLLGAVEYREKANGTPLTEAEKMKYRRMMLYYKSMKNGVDDKVALRLLEELACGKLNEADKSIYKLSRMYGGIESRTFYRLIDDFKETAELLTDGSGVYSEEMEEIVGKLATATHALEVNQFFRERAEHKTENASGFTDEAIQEIIDEANAKLEKLSRSQQEKARNAVGAITNFHSKVLDSLLEGEVITQKTYDTLRDAYSGYVPMFRQLKDNRVIDFDPTKPVKGSTSFEGTIEPLMGRKGSTRPIKDILTSSLEAYSRAVRAIEMNTILRQFDVIIEALKDAGLEGRFVKKHRDMPVLTDMYAIMEDGKEVPADNLTREDLESLGIGTVIRSKSKDVANYVVAKENGEVILYEAHPEVIEALQTMRKASQDDFLREFARKAGEVLRTGATVSPEFTAKNPIRDVFHGYITSDSGVGVKDIVKCAVFMLGKRNNPRLQQLWKEFLEDGGGMGNILNDIIIRHNSFTKEVTGRKSAGDYSPIRLLQRLSHTAENISRFTEYTKARETGASRREAAFRAMDQQDFGMSGKAVRPINSVTPFINSTIQGKYKLYRKFKENPKEFTYRMLWAQLPLTMVSLALRAMANDDQKRKIEEAHAYIRTNYWLIPIPGTSTVARIPKPFDVSMLVANAIESFYDYAMEKDPMTATDALSGWFLDNMRHVTLPNSIFPQLLNITMEARTGYNQFYGIDVVPSSLQDDIAMNQFTSSTPHLCIALGRAMGAVGLGDAWFASPVRTQSIVNTTFGGLGTITLDLTDIALNGLAKVFGATTYRDQVVGKRPHGDNWFANTLGVDVDRLPMARVFLQNTDYGKSIGEVYRKWERLKGQKKMYDRLLEAGQPKAALRAMPDKDWDLYWALKETVDIDNTFGPANSLIRTFRDTTHLSPTDKAYWMKEVGDDRARMARETLLFIRMYEAGITPEALWEQALRTGGMSAEFRDKVKGFDKGFEKYVEERNKTRAAK